MALHSLLEGEKKFNQCLPLQRNPKIAAARRPKPVVAVALIVIPACPGLLLFERMTRKQVAQRLGKSLATVRRMEGVLLHPTQDSKGVNHFDVREVEHVAREVGNGHLVVHRELRTAGSEASAPHDDLDKKCENCAALQQQLEEQRSRNESELASLRAKYDREARELIEQVNDLIATIET